MGAGASKPPIPATHPAGVAFRRKLEEIRRRRKVRAFRDSIVSTTELLKDRTDLESVGDVARLSAVGFETDSAEPAKDAAGAAKDDKPSGEKKDAAKEEAALATTAIASEPAGNVVAAEAKEAAEIDEKKEVAEVVVTKKVEIAEAVTSLAAEVALLKIEEDGEEEEDEEEEKDGSELAAGDLPGSPSFRYFAMINNQAGDSDDSDDNHEAGHGKDDDEEDGN